MSQEGQLLDKKSLRAVWGKTANWSELAKDCIAFANALGGTLLIGIEDGQDISDIQQRIGGEIHPKQGKRTLEELAAKGSVRFEGDKRWRRYWAVPQ